MESHVTELLESSQSTVSPRPNDTHRSKDETNSTRERCNSDPDEKNSVGTVFRQDKDYSHLGMG